MLRKGEVELQLRGSGRKEKESIAVLFTVQREFYAARTTSNAPKLLPQRSQCAAQSSVSFKLNCRAAFLKVTFHYG
jgi:hypothetical protein